VFIVSLFELSWIEKERVRVRTGYYSDFFRDATGTFGPPSTIILLTVSGQAGNVLAEYCPEATGFPSLASGRAGIYSSG
jgi:hypothetical protein